MDLLGVKILAVFVVLAGGILGASGPSLFAYFATSEDDDANDDNESSNDSKQKQDDRNSKYRTLQLISKILTALSVGIVCTTSLVHVGADGTELLREAAADGNSSLDWTAYPFDALFVVLTIIVAYVVSQEVHWYGIRALRELKRQHHHGKQKRLTEEEEERLAARVHLHVLVIGIFLHSVILGLTLGVSKKFETVRVLIVVLTLDCTFDGVAVGNAIATARLDSCLLPSLFIGIFAGAAPLGILIGLGIESPSVTVQGVLSCVSSGLLLHMALGEMMSHVMGHGHVVEHGHHDHPHHDGHDETVSSKKHADDDDDDDKLHSITTTTMQDSTELGSSRRAPDSVPSESGAASGGALHNDEEEEEEDPETTKAHMKAPLIDHHDFDQTLTFRLLCYGMMLLGCGFQCALRVWE